MALRFQAKSEKLKASLQIKVGFKRVAADIKYDNKVKLAQYVKKTL